ncbi:MAG: 2-hydroxy-3-oxopropionate reductase [Blastococcus sp.]|jgi:3-hydroxyisobutyrate dehydrogenase-like beta-hydroxyacid dehydrogenase|nr:2-hydroxy-3-oxopropionate reductase [Blastococcus sp.]
MSDTSTATGFIGLGLMGGPMAANVARAGFPLTVWNRTPAKARPVRELGAQVAGDAAGVAAASDVLITMVSDDAALEDLFFGAGAVAGALRPGSVVVDMSTTSPACMESLAARLAERDVHLVDAPVFGSTDPAVTGDLWAVVGADPDDLDRVRPQLDAMCGTVFHLGPVGAGSLMKVSGNLVVTGMIALLAESLTLGTRGGLDPSAMLDVLDAIDFTSPLWKGKGSLVVDEDYAPRFPLRHALKDVRLARSVAATHGLDLRVVAGAEEEYAAAAGSGHQDEDVMAVVHAVRPAAS